MKEELWKDIKGFDYKYKISNLGRLKYINPFHSNRKNTITNGSKDVQGYLRISLTKNGKGVFIKMHRLVAEYFLDGYSEILTVNHIDFNKQNNAVSNLELISVADNIRHYVINKKKLTTSSKHLGIMFHKQLKKWIVRGTLYGKRVQVGTYSSERAALKAKKLFEKGLLAPKIGKGKPKFTDKEKLKAIQLSDTLTRKEVSKITGMSIQTIFNIRQERHKYEKTNQSIK